MTYGAFKRNVKKKNEKDVFDSSVAFRRSMKIINFYRSHPITGAFFIEYFLHYVSSQHVHFVRIILVV